MNNIDLTNATARIVKELQPEKIILFGSRARGDAKPDSDVDLMVITKEVYGPDNSRHQAMVNLWHLLGDEPFSKDILVYNETEVEQWCTAKNHVIARAMKEGKVLYERH